MSEPTAMTLDEASDLVGDDIAYWLNNPFMDRAAIAAKVCWWIERAANPAEQWTEWGVRRTWGDVGSVAQMGRMEAEQCAREWPGELVSRAVTAAQWTAADPAEAAGGERGE
jgi:hypothetical protein